MPAISLCLGLAALLSHTVYAASIPAGHSYALHEKREILATGTSWSKVERAPSEITIPVRIGITPRNMDLGHAQLMDISDPRSANFGRHWTAQQVHDFFSPSAEAVAAVQGWLESAGIGRARHAVAGSRGSVQFEASVAELEALLGAEYHLWEHRGSESVSVGCDEYFVPEQLRQHISFVTPSVGFGALQTSAGRGSARASLRKLRRALLPPPQQLDGGQNNYPNGNLSVCGSYITPKCIRALYRIPEATRAVAGNDLGIYEEMDVYVQKYLDDFFALYAAHVPNGTHPVLQSVDGGVAPGPGPYGGTESHLDLDVAYPLVYPQPIKLYQVYDQYTVAQNKGLFNDFLDALDASYCRYDGGNDPSIDPSFPDGHGFNGTTECGVYAPAPVISFSYGYSEATYPASYQTRQCHEFLKLGLQGTSVIFSSGDNGTVADSGVYGCLPADSNNPTYPASCPYVTAVGATQVKYGNTVHDPEEAVNPDNEDFYRFSSGGGFSNLFARPAWQHAAVEAYLQTNTRLPAAAVYNASGRGFPDVAANGWNVVSVSSDEVTAAYGTSAAAPLFAAVVTRLNGERMALGKRPLGFLNPTLYANPDVFKDITQGYNLGCNAVPGFYAQKGWDPVTGLGTPDFPKMKALFLSLP